MAQAWHLMRRPDGAPVDQDFALKDYALLSLDEGMVRVRNRWLSVDPYMRGRMNDVKSYVPPFAIDAPMDGGAVGEVVESRDPGFAPGDMVLHMAGWRDEAVLPSAALNKLPPITGIEPQAFLGNMGLTGGTAYFGLLEAASAKPGDIVFVSAAAGAVGSAVVQIAKAKGMTVIGSAGGADKCEFVRSLGADAVVDYKAGPLLKQLAAAAPKGIDVYFDNVGGDHLDAALALARQNARFAICGMIEGYNGGEPTQLRYIMRIIAMRIRLQGFIYTDYLAKLGDFHRDMGGMIAAGQVKSRDTVVEGLDRTVEAFRGLFTGANTGKMLVKL
ncbi:NADP-dependent oxidoreductase [Sphingomonas sp. LY29]|uniref:NADP-dependent oxidoreductase n=1 Tax=Sphingomonas sp. LY29 TaxID=3095341 RepID=UPI002D78ACE9|nr:NADP-dependent oxidoreductase [Sphingomonas sp. LY29]WRP25614.1 NADP-dependent oxidoreductase [Sphingomonas sp. LY29]